MIRIPFDRFVDPPAPSVAKPGTQEHTTVYLKAVSGQAEFAEAPIDAQPVGYEIVNR